MSVLETVTVDNVTYDIHDPKVGSGTLSTSAQTLIPAINELKTGVNKTDAIGTGSLNTTSQTLIGAVNELKSVVDAYGGSSYSGTEALPAGTSVSGWGTIKALDVTVPPGSLCFIRVVKTGSPTGWVTAKRTGSGTTPKIFGYLPTSSGWTLLEVYSGEFSSSSQQLVVADSTNTPAYCLFFNPPDGYDIKLALNSNHTSGGTYNTNLTYSIYVVRIW